MQIYVQKDADVSTATLRPSGMTCYILQKGPLLSET